MTFWFFFFFYDFQGKVGQLCSEVMQPGMENFITSALMHLVVAVLSPNWLVSNYWSVTPKEVRVLFTPTSGIFGNMGYVILGVTLLWACTVASCNGISILPDGHICMKKRGSQSNWWSISSDTGGLLFYWHTNMKTCSLQRYLCTTFHIFFLSIFYLSKLRVIPHFCLRHSS